MEGVNGLYIVYAKPNKHERSQCHLQLGEIGDGKIVEGGC